MRPQVVVDIGNSRIKWGLCSLDGQRLVATASLPENPFAWEEQLARWGDEPALTDCFNTSVGQASSLPLPGRLEACPTGATPAWVLASVRPQRCERLRDWLLAQGHAVVVLERAEQLPLTTRVVAANRVGIDRLLDAVAAKRRLPAGQPAILVDACSAVTVDWLDETHTFCGGSIFPGLRLMAQSLNDYTAFLPLVTICAPVPALPAPDTVPAMETGIFHAVAGGIEKIVRSLAARSAVPPALFVTGGNGALLHGAVDTPIPAILWPDQTLEGILASAEALP